MTPFNLYRKLDWWLIVLYLLLTAVGWLNIFSAVYDEGRATIISLGSKEGMQLLWITISYIAAFLIIFIINPKIYSSTAKILYFGATLLLFATIYIGTEVNGSNSWLNLGFFRFQPAEFSKITTSLLLASLWSRYGFSIENRANRRAALATIFIPALFIVLQKESGTALLYSAFFITLYREGMSGWIIILGAFEVALFLLTVAISPFVAILILLGTLITFRALIGKEPLTKSLLPLLALPLLYYSKYLGNLNFLKELAIDEELYLLIASTPLLLIHIIKSFKSRAKQMWRVTLIYMLSLLLIFAVDYIFDNILKPHQKVRIENLVGVNVDLKGAGYNVFQSKVAIGSGGMAGKGFLKGTQTKYNFVPEQSTDFIFCTIGEEWGFLGSLFVIALFLALIVRIYNLAEKQKDIFTRVFGYSLASILALHFIINIGMTIGVMPVIGIPLPFVSYGGSALLSFTLFLFIFIRLDLDRWR
ncbi:MAG: rod shape-determining protein RodA [Bacteroidales bacterium]